jgi:BASS family bile acid:Na+ symporter
VLLIVAVAAGIAGGRATLWSNFGMLSAAVVSFCAISLTVGYLAPRFMHLAPRQAVAVSLEIGLHNAVVAIGIALSPQLLNNAEMATPAAVYGVYAPLIALTFIFAVRRLDPAYRELAELPT